MNSDAPTLLLHLAPGDPEPVRDQISRQLRDRIIRGELSAGDLLPGHRQLARQHRVAPSTIEAAYEGLIADGLVTGNPAGDVEVAKLGPERRRDLVENLQLEKLVATGVAEVMAPAESLRIERPATPSFKPATA
jgi:DNA-binding transcriptional regulator YhcF (GntR family)